MAKVRTERVTVRLPVNHLNTIDALIEIGELRTRTQAIAEALRDYVNKKASMLTQVEQSAKAQMELQKMAAQIAELKAQMGDK